MFFSFNGERRYYYYYYKNKQTNKKSHHQRCRIVLPPILVMRRTHLPLPPILPPPFDPSLIAAHLKVKILPPSLPPAAPINFWEVMTSGFAGWIWQIMQYPPPSRQKKFKWGEKQLVQLGGCGQKINSMANHWACPLYYYIY